MVRQRPSYLEPYIEAGRRHGAGFDALLWASRQSQEARFAALLRMAEFDGRVVFDLGAGRADLLDYLIERDIRPTRYIAVEVMGAMAAAARAKGRRELEVVEGDFVSDARMMERGADVVVLCGSLNTIPRDAAREVIRRAQATARELVVFNFLSSERLAGKPFLVWHDPDEMLAFARGLNEGVRMLSDYMEGDCTIAVAGGGRA